MRNVVRVVKTSRLCSAIILSFTIVWLRIILNQTRFIPHKIRVDRATRNECAPPHTLASNSKCHWLLRVLDGAHEHESKIFSRLHKMVRESETFYTFSHSSLLRHLFVFISVHSSFVRRPRPHSSVYFTHLHAHTAFGLLCDVCGCCACATARIMAKSRARVIQFYYLIFFFLSLSFSRQIHLETELLRIAQFVGVLLTSLLKFRLWVCIVFGSLPFIITPKALMAFHSLFSSCTLAHPEYVVGEHTKTAARDRIPFAEW